MKLKDIEVGKEYAIGSEQYNERCEVLEVGVHGRVYSQYSMRGYRSEKANYVRITGSEARAARTFLRPWAEQAVINDARSKKHDANVAERKRVKRLHDAAEDLLEALKDMAALMDSLWESVPWGDTHDLDVTALNEAPMKARAAIKKAETP